MTELSDTTGGWVIRGFAQGVGTIAAYALVLWLLSRVEDKEKTQATLVAPGYHLPSTCANRMGN